MPGFLDWLQRIPGFLDWRWDVSPLPLPAYRGYYVWPAAPVRSNLTVVLLTEEGTYFGATPWPESTKSKDNISCAGPGKERILVVRRRTASAPPTVPHAEAHLRIIHSPDSQSRSHVATLRASPKDVLVHYNLESPLMFPADLDDEYVGLFDLHKGYHRRRATAWRPYFGSLSRQLTWVRRPSIRIKFAQRQKSRLLVTAVSNCQDYMGRKPFLEGLRAEMGDQFINLGRCVPSGRDKRQAIGRNMEDKEREFISKGFFYLALENANCEDYVTEKLDRALLSGAVPVVFDAPQNLAGGPDGSRIPGYHKLLPPGTYVNVADFPNVSTLVAHLRRVASNETLYSAYLWPRGVSTEEILRRWPESKDFDNGPARYEASECKLARAAVARLRAAAESGVAPPRLAPDHSCLPPGQLCHFLPKDTCTPGSVADRVPPEMRTRPAKGRRSQPHLAHPLVSHRFGRK